MSGEYCTNFVIDYEDDMPLCRCPNCAGFLPSHFPLDKPFRCNKCGVLLEAITDEGQYSGKVCMKPKHLWTEKDISDHELWLKEKPKREKTKQKTKTKYVAFTKSGHGRRVWDDAEGSFITVIGTRIPLDSSEIVSIVNTDTGEKIK